MLEIKRKGTDEQSKSVTNCVINPSTCSPSVAKIFDFPA